MAQEQNETQNYRGMKRNNGIDLVKLFFAVLRRLPMILVVTVLFAAAAFSYSNWVMPLKYTASIYLYVTNSDTTAEKDAVNQADLAASQSLVETYIVILKNNTVVKELGQELLDEFGEKRVSECFSVNQGVVSTAELKGCLTMNADNATEVLVISAQTKDPEISAYICNAYQDLAKSYLTRLIRAGSVEAIGDAEIPTSSSYPDVFGNTIKAALVGFLLAVCVVAVVFLFDKTLKNEEDFLEFGVPYFGEIPDISATVEKKRKKKQKSADLHVESKVLLDKSLPFSVSESYRALRTNLIFALSVKQHKIVAVTSATASEGKSVTTANLSITLAMMGKKVLLIDGDMRKPTQHRLLSLSNEHGLSEVLGGMKTFSEAVHREITENLDVLTCGACPPNPSELLASPAMQKLLKQTEAEYEYVVVDTPPVNVVTDSVVFAQSIGGLVIVTKYCSTTMDDMKATMQSVSLASAPVLGVIMNYVEQQGIGYGKYKRYGRYGKYGKYRRYEKYGRYGSYAYQENTPVIPSTAEEPKPQEISK